jgi:RimJ/RimL family protein N-acetyltransferase
VALRALRDDDAPTLAAMFSVPDVRQHLSSAPTTIEEFRRFISWVERERHEGRYLGFAIVPRGSTWPVGLFEIWPLDPGFRTAEWGFAVAKSHWGTGCFAEAAGLLIDFAFATLGVRRLEARVAVRNARAQAALRKIGAVREGTLRESFESDGACRDHAMWSILAREWKGRRNRRFLVLAKA